MCLQHVVVWKYKVAENGSTQGKLVLNDLMLDRF